MGSSSQYQILRAGEPDAGLRTVFLGGNTSVIESFSSLCCLPGVYRIWLCRERTLLLWLLFLSLNVKYVF